jgi:simple sugar transport system permease protein
MFRNVSNLIRKFEIWKYKQQLSVLIVFLALMTIFIVGAPRVFLGTTIYISFMSTIPFMAVLALPLTFVVITGEIDLSFPFVMGFCGWLFSAIFVGTGNLGLALLGCLAMGLAAGTINGLIITKFRVPSLIMTIGAMFFWEGATKLCAQATTAGVGYTLTSAVNTSLYPVLAGRIWGIPVQTLWTIAFAVILWLILNRHKIGAHIYCVGDNIEAAKMMGINTDRTKIFVFALLGISAAFSSALANTYMLYYWPSMGEGYLLPVIAAVFLGGTLPIGGRGTIFGTCIGSITIGILEAGVVAMGISGSWNYVFCGAIIIISVIGHSFLRRGE